MRRRAAAGLVLVLLIGIGAASQRELFGPVRVPEGGVVVRIPAGSGTAAVARLLAGAGVVRSGAGFRLLAALSGNSRRLRAGEYRFDGKQRPLAVIDRLVRGDVLLHEVTIPEGLTLSETAALLGGAGIEIEGDLAAAFRDPGLVVDLDASAADLEGFLFPDTYRLPLGIAAADVARAMVGRCRAVLDGIAAEEPGPGPEVHDWVTLASLVEEETSRAEERALVAGVFMNRLRLGMRLQCDPTVVYALRRAGREPAGSLARWLQVDLPYNTYTRAGLPPGPITNPGRAALVAAWRPAETEALYFVADGTGGHRFSRTLAEHNRAVRAWAQAVGARAAR